MTDLHATSRAKEQREAEHRVKRAGYAGGGAVHSDYESSDDAKADNARVRRAFREHDTQLHPGRHTKLKLRRGGKVEGAKAERRIDRRARGGQIEGGWDGVHGGGPDRVHAGGAGPKPKGKAGGHKRGKGHLTIEIHNSNPGERQQAMQQGMKAGAMLGAKQAAAAHPPGAPPPQPGMMPPGGMPPGGMPPGGAPMGARPPNAPPGGMPPGMGGAGAPGGMPRPPGAPPFKDGGMIKVREHHRRKAGGRCE